MPLTAYLALFASGIFLANGVPHFVQGISGQRFQTPFASPPAVGLSSPIVNVLWGFVNLAIGALLLWYFWPKGVDVLTQWAFVWLGALLTALGLAWHFGRVRGQR